jgi:transcriptional regulator with XRE-family HTH domain
MPGDKAVIGARLRTEREKRLGSRAKMARRLRDVSIEPLPDIENLIHMIKEWEKGKHAVGQDYQRRYAAALGIPQDRLFGAEEPAERSASDVLAELLPAGELSARVSPLGRIGQSEVADLAARAHALRLADDVLAGGDLLGPAYRELEGAIHLHRDSSHSEETSHSLLSVIGELAQIAGWVASDAGQVERAAETYELGIGAAREAGNGTLESNLTGSFAYQVANTGDPGEAVRRSVAALDAVGTDGPLRARALAWDRLAWAQAKAGMPKPPCVPCVRRNPP